MTRACVFLVAYLLSGCWADFPTALVQPSSAADGNLDIPASLDADADAYGDTMAPADTRVDAADFADTIPCGDDAGVVDVAAPLPVDARLPPDAKRIDSSALKPLGAACRGDAVCASGSCADGVCCDTLCTSACSSCALAGRIGTCSPRLSGVTCKPTTCNPTKAEVTAHACDGKGFCEMQKMRCTPYSCTPGSTACLTECATKSHCSKGYECKTRTCK